MEILVLYAEVMTKSVQLNQMFSLFESHVCPSLKGKPRIFVVDACRGSERDTGFKDCGIPAATSSSSSGNGTSSTEVSVS